MKALFVSNDPNLFDPESAVRARMRAYASAIGTLHIISRGPIAAPATVSEDLGDGASLFIHRSTASKFGMFLKLPKIVRTLITEEGIDVVSAQDPFEYGWIAMRGVQGTNAKLHVQVHTDFLSPWFVHGFSAVALLNRIRVWVADRVLPHAQGIRTVSIRIQNRMRARYGTSIKKPTVLPLPIPEDSGMEAVPFPANEFSHTILAVGRLEQEKRYEDLIRALTGVHGRYPEAGLFISGEGRQRPKLEKLADQLEIADKVIFLGNRSDIRGLMQNADLFVHTSAYEGYGLVLLEAALAGVPIITTDVGVIGEVLKKDVDVHVVPIANPTALAHEMVGLLSDPESRTDLVQQANQHTTEYLRTVGTTPTAIAQDLAGVPR